MADTKVDGIKLPEKQQFQDESTKRYGVGVRHLQACCMFACLTALIAVRSSMGVAVLAMTDHARGNDTRVTIYDWDKKTQGLILSSFFWGYTAMQIPAGILAKRYGGKPIILVALLGNGAFNLMVPTLAHLGGWSAVCAARVGMGLTQACIFPASHTLLGRWLPARERTAMSGFVYGGTQIGTIIGLPLSGLLAETSVGWQLIYYSMAGVMVVVAAIWWLLSASTPAQHRLMSREEREYIERDTNAGGELECKASLRAPWRHILTSRPVWAVVVAHGGSGAVFTLFFVDMPTYLEKGIGISLKSSALLSALPYVGMWVGTVSASVVCERIYNRGWLSVVTCRKLFNSIGFLGAAAGLVALSGVGRDERRLAVAALVTALTLLGFCSAGYMVNHLDLSPQYGGVLLALTNFSGSCGAILVPLATGHLLGPDPGDVSRWRVVFLSMAGVTVLTNCVFCALGSSQRQPWDDPRFEQRKDARDEEMKPALAGSGAASGAASEASK